MMLRARHYISGASLLEQRRPGISIEVLCLEHRDEILVAKLVDRTKMLSVPGSRTIRAVVNSKRHIVAAKHLQDAIVPTRIQELLVPLVPVRRHREDAEMHEDAEFRALEPGGNFVVLL